MGGGASGTLLAANLLRQARAPLRILLIEKSGRVGRGLAYSTESPRHLLNVPAGRMSAFPEDAEHFLRWARRVEPGTGPGDFVQRRLYGRYLEEVLLESVEAAAPGVEFHAVAGEVVGLAQARGGVRLELASGEHFEARQGVLALGNAPSADLPVPDGGLYASPRYRRSPWVGGGLRHIPAEDSVLVVGTGLTMVDAVLSLAEQGHQGPLHALSRHGLLPHVHRPCAPLRWERPVEEASGLRALLRALRRDVRSAQAQGRDWRDVMDGLRPVTVALWQGLSEPDRRRFLRHLRAFWDVHRHRMAPGVAQTVERLQREGQLHVHAGRVQAFRLTEAGVEVRYRPRGEREEAGLAIHHVINCTGVDGAMTRASQPLMRALLDAGLSRRDALGMGLSTREDGALVDARGLASERLFALGPLRRGDLWETTAVPELRTQAHALATRLLRPARHEPATSGLGGAPPSP